jgi:glycerol-3-phosphate dehydrogenase
MQRDLRGLANQAFEVLVIGGGIHGAIAAWDAALRGLSVALIERADFGSGTSQNSLRIIHGGLRYLKDGNLARIRMMARERSTWMRIAPHLVHPLPCLLPIRQELTQNRLVMGFALRANDLLSFDRNRLGDLQKTLPRGKIISRQELSGLLPGYDVGSATGAAVWYDAQIYNSERLLFEFIQSGMDAGAQVANYVEALAFLKQDNRVVAVHARDALTGEIFDIRARVVINCTGAWINNLLEKAALESQYVPSIGVNVIVDQVWPGIAAGLPSRAANDRPSQVLFIVPWRDKSMIGTWHIPWKHDPESFRINEQVIQDFTDGINRAHPALKLSLRDIHHVTWGYLPVNKADAGTKPVRLTRDGVVIDHQTNEGVAGLISVLGVKYTTARVVAERAVDLAVNKLDLAAIKCRTDVTPVKGGHTGDFGAFLSRALDEAPRTIGANLAEHLAYTYGSQHQNLLPYIKERPELIQAVDLQLPVTAAEILYAARHEMALTLADVVQRRTELGTTGLPSRDVLQRCAELMAHELGWSIERQQQEVVSVIQAYPFQELEKIVA